MTALSNLLAVVAVLTGMLLLAGCAGSPAAKTGVVKLDLGGSWQVRKEGSDQLIPATVPGCIHTDLLAAGKIPDPFYRDNEKDVQWVSETNWVYGRSFQVDAALLAHERVLLHCDGLDTLATISVNGVPLARTDNMFRTYELDVKNLLQPGTNRIAIKFDSVLPVVQAGEAARKLPTWAYPGAAYVRKEPCNFGWDWGPTLITCGIWRPIGLVAFNTARLDDVAILQDHSQPGKVTLEIAVAAEAAAPARLHATVDVSLAGAPVGSGSVALENRKGKVQIALAHPQLWWPAGMGAQPLYTVAVRLTDETGRLLDSSHKRVGLRTLRAVAQSPDQPLHLVVNGVPFFAKGANWIPADSFATRVTKDILRRYMQDAVACNMNTLRFWGGGYYEEDDLYDLCDELGLCIWLDFKFGCTTYPAFDEAFLRNVRQEAVENVKRLRHHPSIALWCGNNEIMFFRGADQWTRDKMSAGDYYKLFRDTLGGVVKELAPQSDYVTGSPDCGDVHFWEVWHGGKPFEVYRNIHGFVSEFGFQSFPEPKTAQAFTTPADRQSVYSPVMKYHERSNRMYMDVKEDGTIGTDKIMKLTRQYFRDPKDFDSTLWLSQITQAYGIKYGAEGWRREMPKSMGCVYWQYNDTWPCSSWASVDYLGRWKALQYAARHFYAPVLVSGAEDVKAGTVDVYVTSDSRAECPAKLTWTVTDLAGQKLKEGTLDVVAPSNKSVLVQTLKLDDVIAAHGAANLLVWLKLESQGQVLSQNMVNFAYPRAMNLVDPQLATAVTAQGRGFVVQLSARHPALWTWLELDGIDARFSDNFVHVTADNPAQITVQPTRPLSLQDFKAALRVRSVYDTYDH